MFITARNTGVHSSVAESLPTLRRLRDMDQTVATPDEDIRGRMVKDRDGQDLGWIDTLLIDDTERKVLHSGRGDQADQR
jgi:hypothetical protein